LPIETGLWIVVVVIASAFTFFSIKTIGKTMIAFSMISMALWMGIAVIHAGGLEVSSTNTVQTAIAVNNTLTPILTNSTQIFIPGDTQANWLGWVFFSFAIFNAFNIARLVTKL
jgi:hypothetical protein